MDDGRVIGKRERELLKMAEEAVAGPMGKEVAQRLENLGQHYIEAAAKLRSGDPDAFSVFTEEDIAAMEVMVWGRLEGRELRQQVIQQDAEDN